MGAKIANNASSTLAADLAIGATSMTVQTGDGAEFPALSAGDWHPATIIKSDGSFEIVKVTASAGDVMTIVRAQEGTAALAFSAGDRVDLRVTGKVFEEFVEIAVGFRNLVINGDFRINQRGYTSGAVLASGAFGHDRWKAGASGGAYTFTQLPCSTQITIASGKSLIHIIQENDVAGGDYVVSWEGTAQGRVGMNNSAPSGAYASSPVKVTGQNAGQLLQIEFNQGTLGKVQVESGGIPTAFELRPYALELDFCEYFFRIIGRGCVGFGWGTSSVEFSMQFKPPMRTAPSVTLATASGTISHFTTGGPSVKTAGAISIASVSAGMHGADVRTEGWAGDISTGASCINNEDNFAISSEI